MKKTILFLSITFAAGLLMTNIYNSLIDAKIWGADLPRSLQTARDYYANINPGNFYRIFSPICQVLALLSLVVFWKKSKSVRLFLGIALLFFIAADVLTFTYFYPRNEILFKSSTIENTENIRTAWNEWSQMNWVRSAIGATGLFFSFSGLNTIDKPVK